MSKFDVNLQISSRNSSVLFAIDECQNSAMEAVGEDEAQSIASEWIRQLEASLLAKVSETSGSGSDTNRHFSERDSVSGRFGCDAKAAEFIDIAKTEPQDELRDELSAISTKESFCRSRDVSGFKDSTSNILPNKSPIIDILCGSQSLTAAASSSSPRVDLELVRQKRLEHFQVINPSYPSSSKQSNYQKLDEIERLSNLSLTSSRSDQEEVKDMLQCEAFSPSLDTDRFDEKAWSSRLRSSCDLGNNRLDDDDDNLRLELWGLRGAVESGQLDIQSYLGSFSKNKTTTCSERDLISQFSYRTRDSNNFNQSGNHSTSSKPSLDVNENISNFDFEAKSHNASKVQQNGFNESDRHPTNKGKYNSPRHSQRLSPQSSQVSPRSGSSARNRVDNFYDNTVKHLCENHETHREGGSKHLPSPPPTYASMGPPWPQIQGALYSGFETSDSEGSVRSINLVHRFSKSDKSLTPKETVPGRSSRTGKGKQKILNELTEYLDSDRRGKQGKHAAKKSGQSSSSTVLNHCDSSQDTSTYNVKLKASSGKKCGNSFTANGINKYLTNDTSCNSNEYPTTPSCSPPLESKLPQESAKHESYVLDKTEIVAEDVTIMAKVCHNCSEINSKAANWCIECGSALVKNKPALLSPEQQQCYEQQCKETKSLMAEALKSVKSMPNVLTYGPSANKSDKSLFQDVSNLMKEVGSTADFSDESYVCNQLSNYKRRWHKSSLAWSSFEPRELSKPPSIKKQKGKVNSVQIDSVGVKKTCSSSDLSGDKGERKNWSRNGHHSRGSYPTYSSDNVDVRKSLPKLPNKVRPQSATPQSTNRGNKVTPQKKRTGSAKARAPGQSISKSCDSQLPRLWTEIAVPQASRAHSRVDDSKSPIKRSTSVVPPLNLNDVGDYDRMLTLIRSQRESDPTPYLYLPDELLLKIFSSLHHRDLVSCARVCWQFYRIAMDETLWKVIVLHKKESICDEWLLNIGKRQPSSLTISQCHGNNVSANGLRNMFRSCSDTLEELDFSGCSGGELMGESILLHIAARCSSVVSVDVSWTNVGDNGVQALVENVLRLECLCLNGCQAITDKSLICVAKKHGQSLHTFEVFGCFNITPGGIQMLGSECNHLRTLNLGQCYKMTDAAIGTLVSQLPELENLDLRGCKQARDSAVKKIVRYCPLLTCLVLANCPLITDVALAEIATNLPGIKSLDICGCGNVSDAGVRALARCCHKMELLDLSSTGNAVTDKSVISLANYCSQSLRILKLSFCADITDHTVLHLAKQCKRLVTLHLYGCKRVRNLNGVKNINPLLTVEL